MVLREMWWHHETILSFNFQTVKYFDFKCSKKTVTFRLHSLLLSYWDEFKHWKQYDHHIHTHTDPFESKFLRIFNATWRSNCGQNVSMLKLYLLWQKEWLVFVKIISLTFNTFFQVSFQSAEAASKFFFWSWCNTAPSYLFQCPLRLGMNFQFSGHEKVARG